MSEPPVRLLTRLAGFHAAVVEVLVQRMTPSWLSELQRETNEAVAYGECLGLTSDEAHEVIREVKAVTGLVTDPFLWEAVRSRLVARAMGDPWRQADVIAYGLSDHQEGEE